MMSVSDLVVAIRIVPKVENDVARKRNHPIVPVDYDDTKRGQEQLSVASYTDPEDERLIAISRTIAA